MRAPYQEYQAVEEAAMKFVKSVAEGNSQYARELFSDEAVLFRLPWTGSWSTGPSSSSTTWTPCRFRENFKARVDVLLLEETLAVVRVLEEGWGAASTSPTSCSC